ncbi:sensor histidine kinase [Lutibacter sp.]|uniref:sensor histidine kinase n=1 Tax=Lutibacter sp. TaxID=1925666 RepID=UPI003564097D
MKNSKLQSVNGNNHNALLFNGVLWFCSFTILLLIFSEDSNPKKIDFIYTSAFLTTIIIPVLLNLYILIPYFLKREKYLLFVIAFISTIILFTQLNIWFFDYVIDYIFPDYYFISYHSSTKLIFIFSVFLIGTTLIKLSEDWIYFNSIENKRLKLEKQQIETQLTALRSQINPHFLFNSLNVIFALALEKKKETTKAIVQLSDILRYVIYDSNTERVTLKNEIILLNNYIEFQKFRHQVSDKINFTYNIIDDDYLIYPMLLLPLIENSFKHGIKGDIENTFINLNITQNNNEFHFFIENNYVKNIVISDKEHSGLGIGNIKKNLDIIYPDAHLFEITKTETAFIVSLKLFIK